jgi:hypothetical protein
MVSTAHNLFGCNRHLAPAIKLDYTIVFKHIFYFQFPSILALAHCKRKLASPQASFFWRSSRRRFSFTASEIAVHSVDFGERRNCSVSARGTGIARSSGSFLLQPSWSRTKMPSRSGHNITDRRPHLLASRISRATHNNRILGVGALNRAESLSFVYSSGNAFVTLERWDLRDTRSSMKSSAKGIDMGLESFAVASDGEIIDNSRWFRAAPKGLRRSGCAENLPAMPLRYAGA